jgi:hypothetical protein
MPRRAIGYATAGFLVLVTVAACSSGGGDKRSAGSAISSARAATGASAQPQTPFDAGVPQPAGQADDASAPPVVTDAKIRTAQMTIAVRGSGKVATQADEAARITIGARGEVDSDDRTSGSAAAANMQLRVPPTRLRTVLARLAKLGKERSRELSTTDVSEKVADVDSRVISAREAIARLRTLYSSATKVGEIIVVEGELSRREADLESLQAQQRTLARQTAMAVITLSLQTLAESGGAPVKEYHGFLGGLERGWDGFVDAAGWVATAVGTAVPFLILVLLLALGGRVLWRRLPRHGAQPAPAPSE